MQITIHDNIALLLELADETFDSAVFRVQSLTWILPAAIEILPN